MLMGFFAFFNCYTLRVNLSVAIVAMVNTTYLRDLEAADATGSNLTDTSSPDDACGSLDDGDNAKLSNITDLQVVLVMGVGQMEQSLLYNLRNRR